MNITKRVRIRKLAGGKAVKQVRYVVNFREPRTGRRKQFFFERQKDAQQKSQELAGQVHTGSYIDISKSSTVSQVIEAWIADREGQIKPSTIEGYRRAAVHICGPLLIGTPQQRSDYTRTGIKPSGAKLLDLLGAIQVHQLTTADIRVWHKTIASHVSTYAANRAKMFLNAALALHAEDTNTRPPAMPTNLGRGKPKAKKQILKPEQIAHLLKVAKGDRERGVYIAFPFLAGTRPSEQLGLLWEDVHFDRNVLNIRRMQERDGKLTNLTKTIAGTREVPMCSTLRSMLLEWRVACPRLNGALHRVFPGFGAIQAWPLPRKDSGGPLVYHNFLHRFWTPALKRYGLPHVTPHSARHSFVSTLQAQGIEVGLVAKIAGHANANVTLGHYTQAVRGTESAAIALEVAFTPEVRS